MAVDIYRPGDKVHPGGFVGVRAIHQTKDRIRQQHFTFHKPGKRGQRVSPEEEAALIAKAHALYKRWRAEAEATRRSRMTEENARNTKPKRGLGIVGITLEMSVRVNSNGIGYLSIGFRTPFRLNEQSRRWFSIKKLGYIRAWRMAVDHWAELYGMDKRTRAMVMRRLPDPLVFSDLAKQLRKEGRKAIPTPKGMEKYLEPYVAEFEAVGNQPLTRKEETTLQADIAAAVERFNQQKRDKRCRK